MCVSLPALYPPTMVRCPLVPHPLPAPSSGSPGSVVTVGGECRDLLFSQPKLLPEVMMAWVDRCSTTLAYALLCHSMLRYAIFVIPYSEWFNTQLYSSGEMQRITLRENPLQLTRVLF